MKEYVARDGNPKKQPNKVLNRNAIPQRKCHLFALVFALSIIVLAWLKEGRRKQERNPVAKIDDMAPLVTC